jgi:hypothetical protein
MGNTVYFPQIIETAVIFKWGCRRINKEAKATDNHLFDSSFAGRGFRAKNGSKLFVFSSINWAKL